MEYENGMTPSTASRKSDLRYAVANSIVESAANAVAANPHGSVSLPWKGGLGTEDKILLRLAHAYGAFGVTRRTGGGADKFKFYYSRAATGSWFAEVWPLWKVSTWFVALAFFSWVFVYLKTGAGCFAIGLLLLLAFGTRSVLAIKTAAVAGPISGFAYARESLPLMMCASVLGVMSVEWAFVFPWSAGKALEGLYDFLSVFTMPFGVRDFMYRIVKTVFTIGVFACGSVMAYQVIGGGVIRHWLLVAINSGFDHAEPEPGTWFRKMLDEGVNPYSGLFLVGFLVTAVCGLALPFMG